jgi:hypothetical protein
LSIRILWGNSIEKVSEVIGNLLIYLFEGPEGISVSPVVVSAIFVFPSHKNNAYMLSKVYCYFVWKRKLLAVRRVGLMTHHEYSVDRPFPVT